jgi:AraC family transcriptional regulator
MGEQTMEQLLNELADVYKMIENGTDAQDQMIKKLQLLLVNDGVFSQIIDFFPYPIAIFTSHYVLIITNRAFDAEVNVSGKQQENAVVQILKHKIDDMRLATAITRVFAGDTFFLEDLKNPFSMFSGNVQKSIPQPDRFHKAIIFPVPADDAEITHGVIVFIP